VLAQEPEEIEVVIQPASGEPLSVSVPATALVGDVKTAIASARGYRLGCQHLLFESDRPLEGCQQLGYLFGDKERRLFLVMAVADDEVEVLVVLLRAFESLRKRTGWPNLRTGMPIEDVRALRLHGVTIVDGHVTELDLNNCGLSGNVAFVRVGTNILV
jgi:hypothetical protein